MSRPVDPDLDPGALRPSAAASPFDTARPARRPRPRADLVLAVFIGGCLGGWLRYGITSTWPARSGQFPVSTLAANVIGAFVLGGVVVLAIDLAPSRFVRPLLGTGFCGGLTTFSSVVVTVDQLFAHGHPATASAYLGASLGAGLAATWIGLVAARSFVRLLQRARSERSPS